MSKHVFDSIILLICFTVLLMMYFYQVLTKQTKWWV